MPDSRLYIACDLGAESGRIMAGLFSEGKLSIEEIHRFPNKPIRIAGTLRWNVLLLFDEMKIGLKLAAEYAQRNGLTIASVSVDSWGVDYVLLRGCEPLLTLPYHYRDQRTADCYESSFDKVPMQTIFDETGIQFMPINTLYQLIAQKTTDATLLAESDRLLLIADYFNYLFSDVPTAEVSLASTTQIYNPRTQDWSKKLLNSFGLPNNLLPRIVESGTVLGQFSSELGAELGLSGTKVVATCSHDTGAAVAAVPARPGSSWAYLSSGTWSLLGVELDEPLINEDVRAANFTNEIGHGGSVRFLKNIVGLWILQECRREWIAEGQSWSYEQLTKFGGSAEPLRSLIQPNNPRFSQPGQMLSKIRSYCLESGQEQPTTCEEVVRCIFDSLALSYRHNLEVIQQLTGKHIDVLHIVGGGSQNKLLNQSAADATGLKVIAGPVEATAIGNLLLQGVALGDVASLKNMREIISSSFSIENYEPKNTTTWEKAYDRFKDLEYIKR